MEMAKFDIEIISEKEPMIVAIDQKLLVDRMDPGFWRPAALSILKRLSTWAPVSLGQILTQLLTTPDHVRYSRGEEMGHPPEYSAEYYTAKGFLSTGYDTTKIFYCDDSAFERLRHTSLRKGDILIGCSGVGSAGEVCYMQADPSSKSCTGDLFVVRPKISSSFVFVFLKTRYGVEQIERRKHGVGSTKLRIKDINDILVPTFEDELYEQIEHQHLSISDIHTQAMTAKTNMLQSERQGNERAAQRYRREYEENLRKAESMLANLIKQVEEIIESKRSKIEPIEVESKVEQLVEVR